jgi:uncharacterized Tic20 family protein
LEALNFQFIWALLFFSLGVVTDTTQSKALGWVNVAIFQLLGIYGMVCAVIGARKAWRGEQWRYPLNIRLWRGTS